MGGGGGGGDKSDTDEYEVVHQIISIGSVNFSRKSLAGYTELTLRPQTDHLPYVTLHCQQMKIYNVSVDGCQDVKFSMDDPFTQMCSDPSKRKLDYYLTKYQQAILKNDYDFKNQGELKVEIPREVQAKLQSRNTTRPTINVRVEFAVEDPVCGIHFHVPEGPDGITIGFAIGYFDTIPEPTRPDVAYFCPRGMSPLLQHTTDFLQRVYPIYIEYLNMSLPYGEYKIVFLEEMLADTQSYASLTTANVTLLHSARIIDQTLVSRRVLGLAIADQYFGVFIVPESFNDKWLVVGIKHIVFLVLMRKIFGFNASRFWVYEQLNRVYKAECNQLLPPLHLKDKTQSYALTSGVNAQTFHMDPILTPPHIVELMELKSMLVMRIVEARLGEKIHFQNVIKKLLALAWTNPSGESSSINALLTAQDFLNTIQMECGKDLSDFVNRYVYQPGFSVLNFSFAFNRKRNLADVTIKQKPLHDSDKYVGQLTVLVQEIDGSFSNTLQVEQNDDLQELVCQSKSRRNKKKKIPLFTGEEVDIDLSHTDQDSPLIWLRVDPEMLWLCKINVQMPD
eukprot:sb/3463505/